MLVRILANRLLDPISINASNGQLKSLSAEETRQVLAQDPVFITIVQSFMKRLYTNYSKELQAYFTFPTATIAAIKNSTQYSSRNIPSPSGKSYVEDLSSSEPLDVLNSTAVILMAAVSILPQKHSDDILKQEILYSYEEAARLKDTTKQIFGITMDADFATFNTIDNGAIIGTGDGSEKFSGWPSWAGVDAVVTAIIGSYVRFIPDFGTISYSINRQKTDVRPLGFVSRRGHTNGPRTIAGSMIGVALKDEPLRSIQPTVINDLSSLDQIGEDAEPYRENMLPDQLPDFDLLVTIQNEYGHAARISLFGITITDVGQTTSVQDLQQEYVYQYTATDIDLLSYVGTGEDAASISLGLEAYKERRDRINEGRTLHSSPFSTPEFWDVWSPEKRLMMEPGDLKLASDFGEYGKNAIDKTKQEIDDKKKIEENRKKLQAQSILPRTEAVKDCQVEVSEAYYANPDSMTGNPPVPAKITKSTVTVSHGITVSDNPEWADNFQYVAPTNLVTKNNAKISQSGSFNSLRSKTLVASNFTYGYAWQTTGGNDETLYLELATGVILNSLNIQYMTGLASYKYTSGETTVVKESANLVLTHKVIKTVSLRFRTNNVWTSWVDYPQDLSTMLASPNSGSEKSAVTLIGLSKFASTNTAGLQYTDAIMIRVKEMIKNPSNTESFEFDHVAISAIVPIGKKKDMVEKTSSTSSCVVNIGTNPKASVGFSRKKTGNSFDKVKLKMITFEGDGVSDSDYYIPENITDYHDTTHRGNGYNTNLGYAWLVEGSNQSGWTPTMSVVLIPDTANGANPWFYLHDLTMVKGFMVNDPPEYLPKYYRVPEKIKVTLYRGSNDSTKTDAENETIDTNFNANLVTLAVNRSRSNYADRTTILQRLSEWASDKTKGILFNQEIVLDNQKGRTDCKAGSDYEESLLINYTDKDANKLKDQYRGYPVVAIKLEFLSYYEADDGSNNQPYMAVTEVYASQYTDNKTTPVARTTSTTSTVNVGCWNVHDFDLAAAYSGVAQAVASKNLDIIVFTEFQKDGSIRQADFTPFMSEVEKLKFDKSKSYKIQTSTNGGSGEDNIAVIFNSDIFEYVSSTELATDAYDRAQLFVRFKIKDTSMYLNVVGCHLKSNFQGTGLAPTVVRINQTTAIRSYLNSNGYLTNSYNIILGDMNAQSSDFETAGSLGVLCGSPADHEIITPKSGTTYTSTYHDAAGKYADAPFDHIIVSSYMKTDGGSLKEHLSYNVNSCQVGTRNDSISDHVMVSASFTLKKER